MGKERKAISEWRHERETDRQTDEMGALRSLDTQESWEVGQVLEEHAGPLDV